MTHRWTVKTVSVGALLFCALGSALGQTHPEPYTLLEPYIRLKDASPEDYLRLAQHLNSFRALPNYLGVRQFTRRRNCQVEEDLSSKTTTSRISKATDPARCKLQFAAVAHELN
jgi:hypothetical protein